MDHDAVVEDWKQNAENRDEENYQLLRSMELQDYGFHPDDLAGQLHKEAFQIVDYARFANCCKKMVINFDDEDIERIAGHLNVPVDKFIEAYLEADDENGPFKARQKPCPFLAEDNLCTIYDARPAVCRAYPHGRALCTKRGSRDRIRERFDSVHPSGSKTGFGKRRRS